jgi:hypothetical protein
LGNLGVAHRALGDPLRAIEFFEQQLAIVREIGDRRGEEMRWRTSASPTGIWAIHVFGRHQACKRIAPTGEIRTQSRRMPQ